MLQDSADKSNYVGYMFTTTLNYGKLCTVLLRLSFCFKKLRNTRIKHMRYSTNIRKSLLYDLGKSNKWINLQESIKLLADYFDVHFFLNILHIYGVFMHEIQIQ